MGRYPRKNTDDYIRSDVASVSSAIGTVGTHHIEAPAAESAASVLALTSLPETGTTTVTEGITQPDVPRSLSVVGNAAGITGNVVVHGTGMDFQPLSETIALNATTKAYGTKAFRTVLSIVLPAQHAAGPEDFGEGRSLRPDLCPEAGRLLAGWTSRTARMYVPGREEPAD